MALRISISYSFDAYMQVAAKLQTEGDGERQREDAIVEVLVDLLLDMERITVNKGLVYVLEEGLESYPVSGTKRQLCMCFGN